MDTEKLVWFLIGVAFAIFILPLIQGWFASRRAVNGG